MCIGLPMRVVETDGITATVEGRGERRQVSVLVVGEVPVGTAVMVHLDNAMRVLAEEDVPLIERALEAAEAAARGAPWQHLMADLIDREPELPAHLKNGDTP